MKKRYIILTVLLAACAVLFWWHSLRPANPPAAQADQVETNRRSALWPPAPKGHESEIPVASGGSESTPARTSALSTGGQRSQTEDLQDWWRTPIEFYGWVVDEDTNPVADAQVDFDCNDTSAEGTSFYHTRSDAKGLFTIKGIQGMLLGVKVNKEGYYAYLPHGDNFYYAGRGQNFVPDATNPVIFRLKKKGVAEPMIRFQRSFPVPKNGSPIEVDLATGKLALSGSSAFRVECWTEDAGKKSGEHFDWKCRVSLPGGGIQPYTEQFPFLAPDGGYAPSDEIDMTGKSVQEWQIDVQRRYFVRTADGKFGRVVFRMIAHGDHFCLIESYFNPSGSRNLEFDPNNVVSGGN
jgi:hypothetical protein